MEFTHVIKRPLLSEKNTISYEQNRYAFEVDVRADKNLIKAAIEALYKVNVVAVNTMTGKARDRVYKYGKVNGRISKKALVRVADGQKIELF